ASLYPTDVPSFYHTQISASGHMSLSMPGAGRILLLCTDTDTGRRNGSYVTGDRREGGAEAGGPAQPVEPEVRPDDEAKRAARRREMYERIARGNALAEAEEAAQRAWHGK